MNIKKDREFFADLESQVYCIDQEIDMLRDKFGDEFMCHGVAGMMCDIGFALHLQNRLIDAHGRRLKVMKEMAASEDDYHKLMEVERAQRREEKYGNTTAYKFSKLFNHNPSKAQLINGNSFNEVLEELGANLEENEDSRPETGWEVRYEFPDGSAIVESEHWWHIESAIKFAPDYQYN